MCIYEYVSLSDCVCVYMGGIYDVHMCMHAYICMRYMSMHLYMNAVCTFKETFIISSVDRMFTTNERCRIWFELYNC